MPFDVASFTLYPTDPGVYLMKGAKEQVLYIGKAKNLKSRLKQYFATRGDDRQMIPHLVGQIETIETIITLTEKDALLLENNLIKRHKPKYNVLLKDDKTFISLLMTRHKWPSLKIIRSKGPIKKQEGLLFGPYTSALSARHTYDLIQKLFLLRECSDTELASRTRPCLLYDIKRCLAPCVGFCTQEEYQTQVNGAARLLKGKDRELLETLKAEMQHASNRLEYEKADALLQTIRQIEHVTSAQRIDHVIDKACDAIGYHREGDAILIALLQIREGKVIGSEHFSFHFIASDDQEAIETFLIQHYRLLSSPPQEILLPLIPTHIKALEEILSEGQGKKISLAHPQKGKKHDLIQMAQKNAKALFEREQDLRSLREKMLLDLQETLRLTRFPKRIECIDTSHLFGTYPVASLCSFIDGEQDKTRIKLFSIKKKNSSEDYASMREALYRHFKREKENGAFCDLLIVDGGKGQLNLALEIFEQLGIASIDLIGLAKESSRHDKGLTKEKIFLPYHKDPILIDARSPMLFLLQKIRDEAHRLAVAYHRKKRAKLTIRSELEDLEGIGPIKRRRLLNHFGSVRALKKTTKQELESVKGLTKRDIEKLLQFIESGQKE